MYETQVLLIRVSFPSKHKLDSRMLENPVLFPSSPSPLGKLTIVGKIVRKPVFFV